MNAGGFNGVVVVKLACNRTILKALRQSGETQVGVGDMGGDRDSITNGKGAGNQPTGRTHWHEGLGPGRQLGR